ncbi:MAG: hypothetical protein GKR90_26590 [Pseudomonadales bacterium]|nr:hypothetical protein [Pseudomonadales bacterium]
MSNITLTKVALKISLSEGVPYKEYIDQYSYQDIYIDETVIMAATPYYSLINNSVMTGLVQLTLAVGSQLVNPTPLVVQADFQDIKDIMDKN